MGGETPSLWTDLRTWAADALNGQAGLTEDFGYLSAAAIVVLGLLAALTRSERVGLALVLIGASLGLAVLLAPGGAAVPDTLIPASVTGHGGAVAFAAAVITALLLTRQFAMVAGLAATTAALLNIETALVFGTPLVILASGVLAGIVFARPASALLLLMGAVATAVVLDRGPGAQAPALLFGAFLGTWLFGMCLRGLTAPAPARNRTGRA
jgi:hypothetical protein